MTRSKLRKWQRELLAGKTAIVAAAIRRPPEWKRLLAGRTRRHAERMRPVWQQRDRAQLRLEQGLAHQAARRRNRERKQASHLAS